MLKNEWKFKIRELCIEERYDIAERDLRKLKLSKYYKMDNVNKLDLDYYLALVSSKLYKDDLSISNKYIDSIMRDIKTYGVEYYMFEYHRCLWLDLTINHKAMTEGEIYLKIKKLSEYYIEIKDYGNYISVIATMHEFQKNGARVLDMLTGLLRLNIEVCGSTLNSFLLTLRGFDESLYIKGKKEIEDYKKRRIFKEVN